MRALPSQFSANSFSGAVATPTCSSSCCCCCCCLTTVAAGSTVAARNVYLRAGENGVVGSTRSSAVSLAAIALPSAIVVLLSVAYLFNMLGVPILLSVAAPFVALAFLYSKAFGMIKAKNPTQIGTKYTLVIMIALIAEAIAGMAIILGTGAFDGYVTVAIILSLIIIGISLRRRSQSNKRT